MAKLNYDSWVTVAAASSLALTTAQKLVRNFDYYKGGGQAYISREELLTLCRKNRMDVFGMANLMGHKSSEMSPFLVSAAGQISDRFEELHRKLLFFHPNNTIHIIPLIDEQRRYWTGSTEQQFYGDQLQNDLENKIPEKLSSIEKGIKSLPEKVSTE